MHDGDGIKGESMPRNILKVLCLALAFALLAAACAGGDSDGGSGAEGGDTDSDGSNSDGTDSDGSDSNAGESDGSDSDGSDSDGSDTDGGDTDGSAGGDVDVSMLAGLEGEELLEAQRAVIDQLAGTAFTCEDGDGGTPSDTATGVTADTIKIGVIIADLELIIPLGLSVDLGDLMGEAEAVAAHINDCGGINGRMLEITEYGYPVADPDAARAACADATEQDGNFIVMSWVLVQDTPLCVTETNETLLVASFGGSREFYDRSDGRYISPFLPEDFAALGAIETFAENGVITADSTVGLLWGDVVDQNVLVPDMREALEATGATVVDGTLQHPNPLSCAGHPEIVQSFADAGVDTVIAPLGGPCYGDFAIEGAANAFFPQYLTIAKSGMTSDVGTSKMDQASDAFDGALGVNDSPGLNAVKDLDESPYAWDKVCHEIYAEGGVEYSFSDSDPYGAGVTWCASLFIIVEALQAAGTDLTQESFIEGTQTIEAVPGGADTVFTGLPEGNSHASNGVFYTQTWDLDCTCWATVDPPFRVEL